MAFFGQRVKELRLERGLTQREIAAALGITERSYQRYETLENPSNENLVKLADFFGVSTDYLLGRTNYWIDKDGHITVKTYDKLLNMDIDELKGLLDNGSGADK